MSLPFDGFGAISLLNDTADLEPSLIDDLDVDPVVSGLDIDFDTQDLMPDFHIRDSISEDSALSLDGSSPSRCVSSNF